MDTNSAKETLSVQEGASNSANLTAENSEADAWANSDRVSGTRVRMRKRVSMKSPVRENCTPGSVRGLLGNWQSYRDLRSELIA